MSTTKEILDEARTVIAALATTRTPSRTFTQHPRTLPFSTPPGPSPTDNFHVQAGGQTTSKWFGKTGTKQDVLMMQVLLGQGPFSGRETDREDFMQRDVERIRDVLEMRTWAATVEACFFEGMTPDRNRFDWWVFTLTFSVHFTGSIATS